MKLKSIDLLMITLILCLTILTGIGKISADEFGATIAFMFFMYLLVKMFGDSND